MTSAELFLTRLHALQGPITSSELYAIDELARKEREHPKQRSELLRQLEQIWCIIEHQESLFWTNIGFILFNCHEEATKLNALIKMNKKIRTNWPDLDKQDRESLLNYVVGEIHTYVFGRKEGMYCNAILNKMNEAFVDILKYEWDGLLMDVVNKLFNGYQTMDMKMLLNGFKVLQMVYEEGFGSWQKDMTAKEAEEFRGSIEKESANVMVIIEFGLESTNHNSEHFELIEACLKMLVQVVRFVSPYHLFNSVLLEKLDELRKNANLREKVIHCYEQIFKYREGKVSGEFVPKIIRKLASVLKDITDDYLIPKHKYKNKDSLSSSTEESSRRRSSSKHEITWNESIRGNRFLSNNGEILYLLKIFLKRYWSYLKRVLSVEERNIEINEPRLDYEPCYLDKDYFVEVLWVFIIYLSEFIEEKYRFNLVLDYTQVDTQEKRENECEGMLEILDLLLRLISLVMSKQQEMEIKTILRQIIEKLTPFDCQFKEFYVVSGLIKNPYEEQEALTIKNTDFTEEYYQLFNKLMQIIADSLTLSQLYAEVVEDITTEIIDGREPENLIPTGTTNTIPTKLEKINLLNRLAWNLLLFPSQSYVKIDRPRIMLVYLKCIKEEQDRDIRKCLSINSKYIAIGCEISSDVMEVLFKSIRVQNDYAREFSVLLLAKFLKGVERVDLELIEPFNSLVDTILELELFRTQEMKYLPIYSALCVVFFRLVESSTVYKEHIVKWLSKLMRQIEMDLFEERCRLIEDVPHLRALGFLMAVIAEMLGHLRELYFSKSKDSKFNLQSYRAFLNFLLSLFSPKVHLLFEEFSRYSADLKEKSKESSIRTHYISELCEFRDKFIIMSISFLQVENTIKAISVKSKQIHPHIRTIVKDQHVADKMLKLLHEDFIQQTVENMSTKYFEFVGEMYEYFALMNSTEATQSLNDLYKDTYSNIREIIDIGEQIEIILAYFKHMQQLMKMHLVALNGENIAIVMEVILLVCEHSYPAVVELGIDMLETMFEMPIESIVTPNMQIWRRLLDFTNKTFELFFSSACSAHEQFERVAYILFVQILMVRKQKIKLFESQKNSNQDTLYLYLKAILEERFGENALHGKLLKSMFLSSDKEQFASTAKDLVVTIMRALRGWKSVNKIEAEPRSIEHYCEFL